MSLIEILKPPDMRVGVVLMKLIDFSPFVSLNISISTWLQISMF